MHTKPPYDENTVCRWRGEMIHLADARMQLTADELADLEVPFPDGTWRKVFQESNPPMTVGKGYVAG